MKRNVIVLRPLHPFHAALLAGTVPLFVGVLLSDFAYYSSAEVQWKNFASWLIVGGLVFGVLTLLFALIEFLRAKPRDRRQTLYLALLLAICVLGFINALVHAGDAWASMPAGIVFSAIVALLVLTATWLGFASVRATAAR
jgi:uncharacterized membrane protein